ncbi:FecR family protein [Compostibacter hankyongensis]|uniref:FecR family protein n=1 Tax=Compostibacter hankyongensis TaxID=1007089 RepID=A0ABP8G1S6_9BACT
MTDENKRLQELFRLYLENKIDAGEYDAFWNLLESDKNRDVVVAELQSLWEKSGHGHSGPPKPVWEEKMNQLISDARDRPVMVKRRKLQRRRWRTIAAVVLPLLLGTGLYFLLSRHPGKTVVTRSSATAGRQDIRPGGNKAVLTLANGTHIALDSMDNGTVARQGGTSILKLSNGQLACNSKDNVTGKVAYNTLTTPRGGKYRIILPDGSKVWLNAASSIRFPATFFGGKRSVDITGEVYFEIAEDASKPFEVTAEGTKVQVLGTHFNVMAYNDERSIQTTLLEGAVKICKGDAEVLLKPGQQARVNKKGEINLIPAVDIDRITAWKNDLFWFDHEDIRSVMRQLSRWYDVDVEIEGNIAHHFSGTLPRNVNVSKVFQVLEETGGIHFKIERHKIIVSP